LTRARCERAIAVALADGLCDPEVDDLRLRFPVHLGDEDVRGLEVAVQDALEMRVLDGMAYALEELEAAARRDAVLVAVLRDRHAGHELHHEVRPARLGGAGVVDARDAGVLQDGQRLPLALEPRNDLARIHAELDEL
jgi:hypothetical protein